MKSIEERAREYAPGTSNSDSLFSIRISTLAAVERRGYIVGATEQKEIDEEVRLKKCDDMTEAEYKREEAFALWYAKQGKGTPTFSDAIEWAREDAIKEAYEWLKARNVLTDASLEGFRQALKG